MVWACQETRGRVRGKDAGNGNPGRRKRGWLQVVKKDMEKVGTVEEDVEERARWRGLEHCSEPK